MTGVIEELNGIEALWEPEGKATIKSFQTLNRFNLFANASTQMTQLKSINLIELDAYYLKFQNKSCSLMQKWPPKKKSLRMGYDSEETNVQESHIFTSGWLSGVISLKVVPPLKHMRVRLS